MISGFLDLLCGLMVSIDALVLRSATRWAHALQGLCGRTNFTIAKVGLLIELLSFACDYIKPFRPELFPGNNRLGWMGVALGVPWILWDLVQWYFARANERRLYEGKALYDMGRPIIWRVFWIGFYIFSIMQFAAFYPQPIPILAFLDLVGQGLGSMIFVYFASVWPMPPGTNKLQEWKEARAMRGAVPAGAGA